MKRPPLALCFATCSLLALPALAGDPPRQPAAAPSTTVAATDRARALHIEGAKLYDEGKYDQAYVAFVAAWALKKHPQIAGNLADCEMKLAKYRDAAEHYRFIAQNAAGDAKPEDRHRAEERLKEVQQKIAAVTIAVDITGASLLLDDVAIGTSPLPEAVFVDAGRHTFEARREGYVSAKQAIDAAVGTSPRVRLVLKPAASSAPPPVPEVADGTRPWLIGGGIAVSAVALTAGVVLTVVSGKKGSDAEAKFSDLVKQRGPSACSLGDESGCADLHDLLSAKQTLGSAGAWSFVGAGVAGAATLGYALLSSKKTSTGLVVTPVVTAKQGGLVVLGTF
jgi:tetratricopeptide (TPR) repeat protein